MKVSFKAPARPDKNTAYVVMSYEDLDLPGYHKALKEEDLDPTALDAGGFLKKKRNKAADTLAGDRYVVSVGLGKRGDITLEGVRQAFGVLAGRLLAAKRTRAVLWVHPLMKCAMSAESFGQAMAEGIVLGQWRHDGFKSEDPPKRKRLGELAVLGLDAGDRRALSKGMKRGLITAGATCVARDWTSRPNNDLHSQAFAKEAKARLTRAGASVRVLGVAELRRLGAGAFLSVNKGSSHPAQMVVAQYNGAAKSKAPVVLVGKGVCFDTGGYSLKLAQQMHRMTDDMAGAAAVLAAVEALANLKVKANVVAIAGLTDNAIDAGATMPGDIVTSLSGRTIEIISTDAEGRMVLCDCLTYAARFKPRFLIDVATLTGGCVAALGKEAMGLFTKDEDLAGRLRAASEKSGERVWRLPIFEEHLEKMKGELADLKNAGDRYASASTAAAFLEVFAGDHRWAHLDIAGTCWFPDPAPYIPSGNTGTATRLLVQLIEDMATDGVF